jgi:hypothetical protein
MMSKGWLGLMVVDSYHNGWGTPKKIKPGFPPSTDSNVAKPTFAWKPEGAPELCADQRYYCETCWKILHAPEFCNETLEWKWKADKNKPILSVKDVDPTWNAKTKEWMCKKQHRFVPVLLQKGECVLVGWPKPKEFPWVLLRERSSESRLALCNKDSSEGGYVRVANVDLNLSVYACAAAVHQKWEVRTDRNSSKRVNSNVFVWIVGSKCLDAMKEHCATDGLLVLSGITHNVFTVLNDGRTKSHAITGCPFAHSTQELKHWNGSADESDSQNRNGGGEIYYDPLRLRGWILCWGIVSCGNCGCDDN